MVLERSFEDRASPKKAKRAYGQFIKRKKKKAKGMDHLSNLPDELIITILSFLPTHIAARTSVLCQRFRHLWEASPSLQLINEDLSHPRHDSFIAMADRALLRRNPSHPLLSLQLKHYNDDGLLPDSYIPSLLSKARSLGLHHLTIEGLDLVPILPSIFSISSLKSLSLDDIRRHETFPSGFTLTCLRSLSLTLLDFRSTAKLNQLLSELCSLEDLHLEIRFMDSLSLSSQTIRNLKLKIDVGCSHCDEGCTDFETLELFLPSLESVRLENWGCFCLPPRLCGFHAEVPLLKRAVIIGPYDILSSGFTLTCLRTLSLELSDVHSAAKLNRLLSELCSLNDLDLEIHSIVEFSLSSQTIKNFKLIIDTGYSNFKTLELFLPLLESVHLEYWGYFCLHRSLSGIRVEVPLLKRAVIILDVDILSQLSINKPKAVGALKRLLKCISHVEELSLHVKESEDKEIKRIPIALGTRKSMPKFPNLKHLDVGLCFHEYNIRAVIMMLHNCPALESLKLEFHEIRTGRHSRKGEKMKEWEAKLLHNANGNYYVYFRNLHLRENRLELRKIMGN